MPILQTDLALLPLPLRVNMVDIYVMAFITLMHHPLYKVNLYQHEQKECQKNCTLAVVMLSDCVQVRAQTLMWLLLLCCFWLFFLSTVCRAVILCQSESWADCVLLKMPKRLIEEHFSSPFVVLWAFAKHLGCRFPSSVSSVVPLTCVVHSCSPLLSWRCLSYLKKAQRHLPEVWCVTRLLAWFMLFVFQWEASQQIHRPLLYLNFITHTKNWSSATFVPLL